MKRQSGFHEVSCIQHPAISSRGFAHRIQVRHFHLTYTKNQPKTIPINVLMITVKNTNVSVFLNPITL